MLICVRPFNLRKISLIRDLDPTLIDKLVTIKGIVIRCSDIIPEMKEAAFRCAKCLKTESVLISNNKILEPDRCKTCGVR